MALTPEEQAELARLNAEYGASQNALPPDEQAELAALNSEYEQSQKKDYTGTWGASEYMDALHDVSVGLEKGVRRGAEFVLDVPSLPFNLLEKAGRSLEYGEPFNLDFKNTKLGSMTDPIYEEDDPSLQYRIPHGQNIALDFMRGSARAGGEYAATAPVALVGAGGRIAETAKDVYRALPNVALVSGATEAATGDEMAADIAGAAAPLSMAAWQGGKRAWEATTNFIRNMRGKTTLDTANNTQLRDAIATIYKNAYPNDDVPMSPEYLDSLVDKALKAANESPNGTLGQWLNDAGIMDFEKKLAKSDRYFQDQYNAKQQELSDLATNPVEEIAPTGREEFAAQAPRERVNALDQSVQAHAERQAAPIMPQADEAAKSVLNQTRSAAGEVQARGADIGAGIRAEGEQIAEGFNPAARLRLQTEQDAQQEERVRDNIAQLQKAAPEGVEITAPGSGGFAQLKQAVNERYDDAWRGAGALPVEDANAINRYLEDAAKDLPEDAAKTLDRVQKNITKLSDPSNPERFNAVDRAIRYAMEETDDIYALAALREARGMLRTKLPPESQALLDAADAQYPAYLTMQRAQRAANTTGGIPNARQLATSERTISPSKVDVGESPYYQDVTNMTAKEAEQKARLQALRQQQTDAGAEAREINRAYGEEAKAIEDVGTAEAKGLIKAGEAEAKDIKNVAQTRVDQIAKSEKQRKQAISDTASAKFSRGEDLVKDVRKAVSEVIKGRSSIKDVKELINATEGNPQALDDLRRAFAQDFFNSTTKNGMLSREGYNTFKLRRPVYEQSGLFSKQELDRIEEGMAEAQKIFLAQDVNIAKLPPEQRRVSEAIAALAGAKAGAMLFGSPLIGASIGRRTTTQLFEKYTKKQIEQLAGEIMLNPNRFADLVERLKDAPTPEQLSSILDTMFRRVVISTAPAIDAEITD